MRDLIGRQLPIIALIALIAAIVSLPVSCASPPKAAASSGPRIEYYRNEGAEVYVLSDGIWWFSAMWVYNGEPVGTYQRPRQ